ncbi:hypothetical protein [Methanosphaera sp. WGK6]|uniref:hypothetical protein n=1 Tax=Methanosphaera sp. WGK6 TaxID=1561964 RepID=UPI00084C009E|nr:hypothetical protein [Methanosphaera sp. WGK6]OED30392.1 hypothetical protein NL43_03220 [Methanosphaera sp. WGK6]
MKSTSLAIIGVTIIVVALIFSVTAYKISESETPEITNNTSINRTNNTTTTNQTSIVTDNSTTSTVEDTSTSMSQDNYVLTGNTVNGETIEERHYMSDGIEYIGTASTIYYRDASTDILYKRHLDDDGVYRYYDINGNPFY